MNDKGLALEIDMRLPTLVKVSLALLMAVAGASAQSSSAPIQTNDLLDLPVSDPSSATDSGTPIPPPTPDQGGLVDRDQVPPTFFGEEIDSESDTIIYVIDTSGSMDSDSQPYVTIDGQRKDGTRIERAKTELMRSIAGLSSNFKFNVVAYECTISTWHNSMVQANEANKTSAIAWVSDLQPSGATATGPGMALALGDRSNLSVVLLTDGAPNCGTPNQTISEHRALIRCSNMQHAKINVFGIAASGAYRYFCESVASDSGGAYFDIP